MAQTVPWRSHNPASAPLFLPFPSLQSSLDIPLCVALGLLTPHHPLTTSVPWGSEPLLVYLPTLSFYALMGRGSHSHPRFHQLYYSQHHHSFPLFLLNAQYPLSCPTGTYFINFKTKHDLNFSTSNPNSILFPFPQPSHTCTTLHIQCLSYQPHHAPRGHFHPFIYSTSFFY